MSSSSHQQPMLARLLIGLALLVAAAMFATGALQQIINVNYTDLGGRTVTGSQIGLLYTCVPSDVSDILKDNNDSGKFGSFFKVTTGGRELTCWNNWAFDQSLNNRLYRAIRSLGSLFSGKSKVDYSTVRAIEWTAIAFFMLAAFLAFLGAITNFFKRTQRFVLWLVGFGLLFSGVAFGMGAYASTTRARISASSALYLAVASLGNKTYSPAVGAFLLIVGLILIIAAFVTLAVFRNRASKADGDYDIERDSNQSWRSDRTERYNATWASSSRPARPTAPVSEVYEPANKAGQWPISTAPSALSTMNNTPVNTPPGSRPSSRAPMTSSAYTPPSRPAPSGLSQGQSFWQKTFGRQ